MKTKKSWQEKLRTDHGLPKVAPIPARMKKQWGTGKFLVPAPREVDALMKKVKRGKVTTIDELRASLAAHHGAAVTCPMTAGIFANLAARAADEQIAEGKRRVTPYWRTLKVRGELNPKFPGGLAVMKSMLEAEGHTVEVRGKRMFVVELEKCLVRPAAD